MKARIKLVSKASLALTAVAALALGSSRVAKASDENVLVVVVNPNNPIVSVSKYDVARMFRGMLTQWPEGKRIQVIDYPVTATERRTFYRIVFGTGPQRIQPRGSPYVFRPIEQEPAAVILRLVAVMPNAVAYMHGRDVDDTIKVVATLEARP